MKRTISLLLTVFVLFSMISCPDSLNQSNQPKDHISTTLTITSKNISAIAPYVYESSLQSKSSEKALSIVPIDGQSYLSYLSPDSIGFQPLVFESSTGTKVILEGTKLYDIGSGCTIDHIEIERAGNRLWVAFRDTQATSQPAGFVGLTIQTDGGLRLEESIRHEHFADRIVDFESKY